MGFPKKRGKVLKSPRVVVCFWRWRDTVHSCAWPAGWGLSCPPRVAIRRTTLWCCSFSSRFSSRFPAPPKEVKVHTGTDYHSMVSECRVWPSGGQESKKNLRQHSVLDWSPTSILSGPCDACLRGSDETRNVHRGMAADENSGQWIV